MSRAWFALAVVAVLGLFYVGYGLQSGPGHAAGNAAYGQEAANRRQFTFRFIGYGDSNGEVRRAKIAGGWLVSTREVSAEGKAVGLGLAFVPDPEHKWDGNSLP